MRAKKLILLAIGLVVVAIALALVLWGGGLLVGDNSTTNTPGADEEGITSFEECVEAGYPVMESFPRQCTTSDGTTFVEDVGSFNGGTDVEGATNIQTPAGPLSLQYESGFLRLTGTLQRNNACINWVVDTQTDGREMARDVIFNVQSEREGEVCAQVISEQQISTLVRAASDAQVTIRFEGEVALEGQINANQ